MQRVAACRALERTSPKLSDAITVVVEEHLPLTTKVRGVIGVKEAGGAVPQLSV